MLDPWTMMTHKKMPKIPIHYPAKVPLFDRHSVCASTEVC